MDSFDVALKDMGGGRDADVLAVAEGSGEAGAAALTIVAADELRAVIGLPDQVGTVV